MRIQFILQDSLIKDDFIDITFILKEDGDLVTGSLSDDLNLIINQTNWKIHLILLNSLENSKVVSVLM